LKSTVTLTVDQTAELIGILKDLVSQTKSKIMSSDLTALSAFPLDAAVPFIYFFHAIPFASDVRFNGDTILLEFSLEHLGLITAEQAEQLKPIDSSFHNLQSQNGTDIVGQVSMDDNALTSLLMATGEINKYYSLRDLVWLRPQAEESINALSTSVLGAAIPSFLDYGKDKPVDILFTPSQKIYKEGMPTYKKQ